MPRKKAEVKPPRVPVEVVADLAPAYKEWKDGEKSKEKYKTEFFAGITEWLKENAEPEEDYLIVIGADEEEAIFATEQERPGWIVEGVRPYLAEGDEVQVENGWEAIVVENPAFMPFTIEFDGKVYGRQIVEGSSMLDNERIEAEDPELWKRVAQYPNEKVMVELVFATDFTDEMTTETAEEYVESVCETNGIKRQLISLDEMSDKDAGSLQAYMYMGPPTVKLPAPTKIKESVG